MEFAERLDAVIDRALQENRIVGAVVIATRDGKEIFRRATGMADRESGTPVRDDTIFRLASVTKPIVAATALALVDRGVLRLDAPVTDYLPYFTPPLPDGRAATITLHHLLTHTAGLGYGGDAFVRAGVATGENTDITLEENTRRLANVPLLYAPGTAWAYSMALDVTGAIIAAVEHSTLGEAVAKYVTGPLGMADTLFGVADRTRLATAYANAPDGGTELMRPVHAMPDPWGGDAIIYPERIFNPNAYQSGGGGMAGTAPDFLRFLNTLLDGGAPILSGQSASSAFANKIGAVERDIPGEGFSYFGALAHGPSASGMPCSAGTVRWGGTFGNHWFIDPQERLTLVAFTNTAFEGCDGPFRFELRDAAYPVG